MNELQVTKAIACMPITQLRNANNLS